MFCDYFLLAVVTWQSIPGVSSQSDTKSHIILMGTHEHHHIPSSLTHIPFLSEIYCNYHTPTWQWQNLASHSLPYMLFSGTSGNYIRAAWGSRDGVGHPWSTHTCYVGLCMASLFDSRLHTQLGKTFHANLLQKKTSECLDSLELISELHASVEKSSLRQVQEINANGLFVIQRQKWMRTADDCVKLLGFTFEKGTVSKIKTTLISLVPKVWLNTILFMI